MTNKDLTTMHKWLNKYNNLTITKKELNTKLSKLGYAVVRFPTSISWEMTVQKKDTLVKYTID